MNYKESLDKFSLLAEGMTKETAKRRIENITSAIEGTKESMEEFRKEGNHRAVQAHESYIKSMEKNLADAKRIAGMNEAVIRSQIPRSAQKEVRKSREEHKRVDSELLAKKGNSDTNPELHAMTPLAPEKKKLLSDIFADKEQDTPDDIMDIVHEKNSDTPSFSPDDIWRMNEKDKSEFTPFIYLPKSDEFFYISPGKNEDVNKNDEYDLKNYFGGMPFKFRTHGNMIDLIDASKEVNPKLFKKDYPFYAELSKNRKLSRPDDTFIMGRHGRGVVSFWNKIDDNMVKNIVKKLKKNNPLDVNIVYVPNRNVQR